MPEVPLYEGNARSIFGNAGRVWATALRLDPPKKGHVRYSSGWWDGRQIVTASKQRGGAYVLLSGRYWAGTHFGRPRFVGAQILSDVFWLGCQSMEVHLDRHPRAPGSCLPGCNLPGRDKVYRLASEVTLFRGMLTGSEAFLEPPGVSGLRTIYRTNLKEGLVPHSSG